MKIFFIPFWLDFFPFWFLIAATKSHGCLGLSCLSWCELQRKGSKTLRGFCWRFFTPGRRDIAVCLPWVRPWQPHMVVSQENAWIQNDSLSCSYLYLMASTESSPFSSPLAPRPWQWTWLPRTCSGGGLPWSIPVASQGSSAEWKPSATSGWDSRMAGGSAFGSLVCVLFWACRGTQALVSRSCFLWELALPGTSCPLPAPLAVQTSDAEGAVCEERHAEGSAGLCPTLCRVCVTHQGSAFPGRGSPEPGTAGHRWPGEVSLLLAVPRLGEVAPLLAVPRDSHPHWDRLPAALGVGRSSPTCY